MPWMQFAPDSNYYPIIYFNDFWLLRDKLVPVNETLTSTTLHLDTGHLAFFWCVCISISVWKHELFSSQASFNALMPCVGVIVCFC